MQAHNPPSLRIPPVCRQAGFIKGGAGDWLLWRGLNPIEEDSLYKPFYLRLLVCLYQLDGRLPCCAFDTYYVDAIAQALGIYGIDRCGD